jgi:hypothetical protein
MESGKATQDLGEVTMRQLCPTLRYDFAIAELASSQGRESEQLLEREFVGWLPTDGFLKQATLFAFTFLLTLVM